MHSQNNEEAVLLDYFGTCGGRLLDIGAHDGVTFSNSRALIEKGWSGVLVEPAPEPFTALLRLYGGNPAVALVNAAVGAVGGLVTFHESHGDMVGSISDEHARLWSRAAKYRDYTLCAITPTQLLDFAGRRFDLINVDVEGGSADLFHALVAAGAYARAWCVEYDGRGDELAAAGAAVGLRELARNAENIILAI